MRRGCSGSSIRKRIPSSVVMLWVRTQTAKVQDPGLTTGALQVRLRGDLLGAGGEQQDISSA
jgi:hypothetical protein